MLLVQQIGHAMPLGYRFADTGAPRGEPNYYLIEKRDGDKWVTVYRSFKLRSILNFVLKLAPTSDKAHD